MPRTDMLQLMPQLLLAGRAYDIAVGSPTSTTLPLSFLYVPGARSYEYAISTTSAIAGFGAWTALPSDKIITGLSSSTQYWVKVRIVNGVGRGPASPVVTATTSGGGGGSPVITMTAASAQNGGFGALSSFSMSVGSYNAATDDLILFAGCDFAFGTTAPTIGGVLASVGAQNADNQTAVYYIPRGSGVSVSGGNVTMAPAGSYSSVHFAIGYCNGAASGTPSGPTTSAVTGFTSPNQMSGTVPASGVGVAYWHHLGNGSLPISWLPAGWARVAASEASQGTGNGSQGSCATQATPTAGTYTFDAQTNNGGYAFIAFA